MFKTMKIRRIYDEKSKTLMYVSYSTKETSGSYKHSLSTVPLWGTKAYAALVANETLPEVNESSTSQQSMTTEDESEKSSDPIF
ncbi:protein creA [Vibrio ishigakensis]|uniref:Protein creA n=1 Tax=Vibrio ishigakensis TaxID=1481914 RepID=A0A0B8P017_9VIBR|nr:protein creA [Vibrio ishigakensis]